MGLNMLNACLKVIIGSSTWRKATKCKSLMKQLKSRLAYQKSRRGVIVRQSRDDIAQLRRNGQHHAALPKVKQLYIDQCRISAYNQLEGFCDCISTNLDHLSQPGKMSTEVLEAVSSIVFAASRCGELPELHAIRNLFRQRYGQKFDRVNVELQLGNAVNSEFKHNFVTAPVARDVMQTLIKDIDNEYKIHFMEGKLYDKATNNERIDFEKDDNRSFKDQLEVSTLESMLQKLRRLCSPTNADFGTQLSSINNSIPGYEHHNSNTRSVNLNSKNRSEKIITGDRSNSVDKVHVKDAKSDRSLTSRCLSPSRQARGCRKDDKEVNSRSTPNHVHPKLPDHDELVKEFTSLKKNNYHRNSNYQGFFQCR